MTFIHFYKTIYASQYYNLQYKLFLLIFINVCKKKQLTVDKCKNRRRHVQFNILNIYLILGR